MIEQKEFKLLYDAFFAIAESYTSIIYVDVEDKSVYPIKLDDYSARYEEELNTHPLLKDIMARYVSDTVYDDDADMILRLADCDLIKELLVEENPVLQIYRTVRNDEIVYYRMKIVPIEDGKKLVYGFENIDRQYRKQLEANSDREQNLTVLDGLSREYLSVWYLDGKSRKVKLIKNNGLPEENAEQVRIGETLVDYHFSMQKYFGGFVNPEDFERLMHETSYDFLVENASENDMYCVDYIRVNPEGNAERFQACYAKTIDAAGVANFVVGFRNLDRLIDRR